MDCEGAEYDILYSAGDLLKRVDYIVGELHMSPALKEQGRDPKDLVAFCNERVGERAEFSAFSQIR